jgi:hypothetical protein
MQQTSRDKFDRFLRATTEFTLCVLDRYGLRDHWPARPTLTPQIRFLYIGSRICSTLPSDPASRRRPCASLSLLLYQDVKRTYTSKMSIMLGVPKKGTAPRSLCIELRTPRRKTTRLVARRPVIGRCGRCRGRFADGKLILFATEENLRQGLVTSLVGASRIPARRTGFL